MNKSVKRSNIDETSTMEVKDSGFVDFKPKTRSSSKSYLDFKPRTRSKSDSSKKQNVSQEETSSGSSSNGKTGKAKKHPPTSTMVMESIQALKRRNGASLEDIKVYMEENYEVSITHVNYHIKKFLAKAVSSGELEKIGKNGAEEKFKIAKSGVGKKDREVKPRKMAATKKQKKEEQGKNSATKKQKNVKAIKKTSTKKSRRN